MRRFAPIAAIVLLVSCAKPDLTRDEAQRLLAASQKYPKAVRIAKVPAGEQGGCEERPDFDYATGEFIMDELLTFESNAENRRDPRCPGGRYYEYLYSLTPEGEKYVDRQGDADVNSIVVKQCVAELGQVTGVATEKDGRLARAQYTTKVTPTPFNVGAGEMCPKAKTHTATFRRYDDGWRLERETE